MAETPAEVVQPPGDEERAVAANGPAGGREAIRDLFESMAEGFALHEIVQDEAGRVVDYRYLDVNPAFERMTGISREGWVGRTVREVLPGAEPKWIDTYGRVALTGETVRFEDFTSSLGRWYQVVAWSPRPCQFAVLALDVTDRKSTELALREATRRLELALAAARLGVWELDPSDGSLTWDGRMAEIHGIPREAAPATADSWERLVHPEDLGDVRKKSEALLSGEKDCDAEFRIVRPDGSVRHVKASCATVRDRDGRVERVTGLIRDVTEERLAARALCENEAIFQMFLEKSPIYVFFKDKDIRALRLSRNFEELLGRPLSELLGKNMDDLFPSDLAKAMVADDQRVLREGRPIEVHEEFEGRHYDTVKFPVLPEGSPAFLAGYTIDVTDRWRAFEEVRALNEGLEQRVKERTAALEAANRELEAFAYSVSHDLRAPLRHVDGFLSLLEEDLGGRLDAEDTHLLESARAAALRMGRLIDALLDFSRTTRAQMHPSRVELDPILAEVLEEQRPTAPGPVEWRIGALPAVRGDRALLRIVLTNLVSNALKFSAKTGHPVVEVGPVGGEGNEAGFFVKDNGAGFDPAYAGKLFGVFQRLHRQSDFDGLGIGLATVHRIVGRHGGRIVAESSPRAGASFRVFLPGAVREDDARC